MYIKPATVLPAGFRINRVDAPARQVVKTPKAKPAETAGFKSVERPSGECLANGIGK